MYVCFLLKYCQSCFVAESCLVRDQAPSGLFTNNIVCTHLNGCFQCTALVMLNKQRAVSLRGQFAEAFQSPAAHDARPLPPFVTAGAALCFPPISVATGAACHCVDVCPQLRCRPCF